MDEDDFLEDLLSEENEGQKKKKVIELKPEEKEKIKVAMKKMEENMVQPQNVVGKTFSGAGFSSKPDKIVYKDFEVGIPMEVTIELTNCSLGFNSFKLLPLDDEIIDFFDIIYMPCGRVPAGISTQMTLKFMPMVNKDFSSNLKLLSETGMVLVPIEILSKKCIIKFETPVINFGIVILGQVVTNHLQVENSGALECMFSFLDDKENPLVLLKEENGEDIQRNENIKQFEDYMERIIIIEKDNFLKNKDNYILYFLKQMTFQNKLQISSYSKKSIPFELHAKFVGEYSIKVLTKIEYRGNKDIKWFEIKFNVIDVPVYVEKKILNLDYIIQDNIFREKIKIFNNSNISYKIQMNIHSDIQEFIELNPYLGYIQSNSSFDIWIKLKPFQHLTNLNKFFKTEDGLNGYNFPIKITIANLNLPIIVILNFYVTVDSVEISKKFLNLEQVFLDEANKITISLENKSLLPQTYGFIMLPKEITAKNNIDTILPGEKVDVDITYKTHDQYLGHREGDIFCKVITNELSMQNIKLKYHVEIINTEVLIHPKYINFPALPEGEKFQVIITIKNKTKENYTCEWLLPPETISGITIMPKVFELLNNNYTTCIINYNSKFRPYGPFTIDDVIKELTEKNIPTNNPDINTTNNEIVNYNNLIEEKIKQEVEKFLEMINDQDKGKKKDTKQPKKEEKKEEKKKLDPKKDKKLIEEEERLRKEEEEKKIKEEEEKKAKRVKEFRKESELKAFGAEINDFDDDIGKSQHTRLLIPLFYRNDRNGIIKRSGLEVNTTCVEKKIVFDKLELNFGEISVKTRKTLNLVITNNTETTANLKIRPLIVSNCFQTINSLRPIKPGASFNLIVEFFPDKDLPYFDELTIYKEDTISSVKLKGIGVQPDIEVSVRNGNLFMGNTMINNPIEKTFDIINKSSFPINYEILTLKSGKKNKTGIKPFTFIPYKSEIAANSKKTVKVIFNGDHQDYKNFFEKILVDVPNQKVKNYIFTSAAVWHRELYYRDFFIPEFPKDQFFLNTIEQEYFTDPLNLPVNLKPLLNEKILLEFVKYSADLTPSLMEKALKQQILIGNCKLTDPKSEKNGGYEIIIPKEDVYFTCDQSKGTLNPGQEVTITFNFKRPTTDPLFSNITSLNGIGMWIMTKAELKLNGGFVPAGITDAVSIELVLKAYVEQI